MLFALPDPSTTASASADSSAPTMSAASATSYPPAPLHSPAAPRPRPRPPSPPLPLFLLPPPISRFSHSSCCEGWQVLVLDPRLEGEYDRTKTARGSTKRSELIKFPCHS
eukprot:465582-Hanusia_phi.AAC.1